MTANDELTDEEIRQLRPNPEYVRLGYFVFKDGQVWVTPKGLEWLRSILPLLEYDGWSRPC